VNDNNDADRRSTETAHSSDVSVSDLAIRDLQDSATDDSVDQIHRHYTDQAQRMHAIIGELPKLCVKIRPDS